MSYLVAFLCGILTSLPLIFNFLSFLPWVSFVPLLLLCERKKSAYRHGLAFSLGYYGVTYYWFTCLYPFSFEDLSPATGILLVAVAWVGLSLFQGVGTALVPFLYRKLLLSRKTLLAPLTAASLWCVMEWFQTQFWFGVPWARLAVTQVSFLPTVQSASLFGSLFIGFLIVLVNGLIASALRKNGEEKCGEALTGAAKIDESKNCVPPNGIANSGESKNGKTPNGAANSGEIPIGKTQRGNRRFPWTAALAAGLVLLNLGYGAARLYLPRKESEKTLVASCIQGNISSGDKWADSSVDASLAIYFPLTRQAVEESGANLVVWPETVIIVSLNNHPEISDALSAFAKENGIYLAVGTYYTAYEEGEEKTYNALCLFHPDGTVNETVYKKRHLVPFGEYLPMAAFVNRVLPFLADMNQFEDNISPGEETNLFSTECGKLGALICFDSIYEELTLSSVREGAELMLLSTNDSWYYDSAAVYQHNGHAVLRAVETGRSFVRAANTGISSLISPRGEILGMLPPLVEGTVSAEVPLESGKTLYLCIGDLIVWLCLAFLGGVALYKIWNFFRKKSVCGGPAPTGGGTTAEPSPAASL